MWRLLLEKDKWRNFLERCLSLRVPGIELGSLNLGSINMYEGVYQNPVDHVQHEELKIRGIKPFLCVFDLSMFYNFIQPGSWLFVLAIKEAASLNMKEETRKKRLNFNSSGNSNDGIECY